MDSWHATVFGLRHLPREVAAFEVEVFLQFCGDQNVPANQELAVAPRTVHGKYALSLPYVIARKTRGPL